MRDGILDIEFVGQLGVSGALFEGALAYGGDRLGNGIGYSSQDGVGDHHGEDYVMSASTTVTVEERAFRLFGPTRSLAIVGIVSGDQSSDKNHFDEEDDGM